MGFSEILAAQLSRYPLMRPRDCAKLAYQSEFGAEHAIESERAAVARAVAEWREADGGSPSEPEDIGGGLCRYPLRSAGSEGEAELIGRLFCASAALGGDGSGLAEKLGAIRESGVAGVEEFLDEWAREGHPAVSHSDEYRAAYSPHYRLLAREYAALMPALRAIAALGRSGTPCAVAIDGRCGSGKTRLGALCERVFDCNLLHLDDFYLPLEKRAEGWERTPAANIDFSRFRSEALEPSAAGKRALYRPYSCQSGEYEFTRELPKRKLTIVEGSYSEHPRLADLYALKIFITCPREVQAERLRAREGDYYSMFEERWIPLEEGYFAGQDVERRCEILIDTGGELPRCEIREDMVK